MRVRLVVIGFVIWLAATVALRLWGQHVLRQATAVGTTVLFALTATAMALVVRRICRRAGLPRDEWLEGAVALALPTLVLDPFSSAFFPALFPNIAPEVAGVFGGLMLCCCAGALLGTIPHR
jgi:Family of unknown function (DUF5367)